MELAKKATDASATVCPLLSNHEIFEKWRGCDPDKLTGEQRRERERDCEESRRRYDLAFYQSQSHSTNAELKAFWTPLGYDVPVCRVTSVAVTVTESTGAVHVRNRKHKNEHEHAPSTTRAAAAVSTTHSKPGSGSGSRMKAVSFFNRSGRRQKAPMDKGRGSGGRQESHPSLGMEMLGRAQASGSGASLGFSHTSNPMHADGLAVLPANDAAINNTSSIPVQASSSIALAERAT
jgi:hypothetical protein